MIVRRFNDSGIQRFKEFLDQLRQNPRAAVPRELLIDRQYTEEVRGGGDANERDFSNRMAAATFLDDCLRLVKDIDVDRDVGLWVWLTLQCLDAACPADHSGARKVLKIHRYVPAPDSFKHYYRHLLSGPYQVFRAHKDRPARAMALLCGRVDAPGEVVEQLAAHQTLITNKGVVELVTQLYYDDAIRVLKRGAGGSGRGSPRRLTAILKQLEMTYDLSDMPWQTIARLLPSEFKRFLPRWSSMDSA